MALEFIGIIGLVLILVGWISETVKVAKMKQSNLDFKFVILYFLGSLALFYHALVLDDGVFMALNGVASILGLLNVYFVFRK